MTQFEVVYDSFLNKMLDDEWEYWPDEQIEQDLFLLLQGAIGWFKFPRVSLEYNENGFIADLSNDEIQILAAFMKCEWLNRTILTWEHVKPLYEERDFSQANLIDKLHNLLDGEQKNAKKLEANYYRSVNKQPFDYKQLAKQS